MVSYVNVDYDKLDEVIKARGTTRAKCAEYCGINPGTLGNSFKRGSKMKADLVVKLSKFLNVRKIDLLAKDEFGNIRNYNDWEAIGDSEYTSDFDRDMDNSLMEDLAEMYSDLNYEGKQKLYLLSYEISELLHQISKFRSDYPDYEEKREEESDNGQS